MNKDKVKKHMTQLSEYTIRRNDADIYQIDCKIYLLIKIGMINVENDVIKEMRWITIRQTKSKELELNPFQMHSRNWDLT